MKQYRDRIILPMIAALVVACSGGGGSSSSTGTAANVTTTDFSKVTQYATVESANTCLSIANISAPLGAWNVSGSFNIINSCKTAQAINGVQVIMSSTGYSLLPASFALNSVSFGTGTWAAVSATAIGQTVNSYSALLITFASSGVISPNATITASFHYNPNGSIPGSFNVVLDQNATPNPNPTPIPTPSPTPTPIPTPTPTPDSGSCSGIAAWNSAIAYTGGAFVVYNGIEYVSNWWTQNNNPATNNGGSGSGQPWTIVRTCGPAPIITSTVNLSIDTTSLAGSICNTCNIPVVLSGQNGQFESTVAIITNSNAGTVIKQTLTNLAYSTYTLTVAANALPANVSFNAPAISLTNATPVNESAAFSVKQVPTSKLTVNLGSNPNSKVFSESYIGISLINSSGSSVGGANAYFGQTTIFNSLPSGNYTIKSYGLADAIKGIYYNPLNQIESIVAPQAIVANIALTQNTVTLTNGTLAISGLESGDVATITITDQYTNSQYMFNTFSAGNGNTTLKLLPGDKITLNISVNSKYIALNPVSYTVTNSSNVTSLTFSQVPAVTKVYSAYKDVTINANWNTNIMSTLVNANSGSVFSSTQPLVANLPSSMPAITWAFATGDCTNETWGGMTAVALESNIPLFIQYKKNYIISTGGASGVFTCSSGPDMLAFVNRYMSANMIGLDFDIEGGQTQAGIISLVNALKYVQGVYPNLRISFTLASLADSSGGQGNVNQLGIWVINAANTAGLNYIVNLMVMDYGATSATNCVVVNGQCEMGQSAIQAAQNVHNTLNIPYSRIELTPMIGNNDTAGEVFTLQDATLVANYVVQNGLAGIHFWSYDRDTPCASQGSASPTCSYIPNVITSSGQFSKAFYSGLGN